MVEKITEGEWGGGNWFPVLVGACAYVVARQNHLPLTIVQVSVSISLSKPLNRRQFSIVHIKPAYSARVT